MKIFRLFIYTGTIAFSALSWGGSFTVTSNNDTGPGSLRQAILDLNSSTDSSNTITIDSGLATITLASDLPLIEKSVSITTSGATPQVIDGNAKQFRLLSTLSNDGSSLSISIQNCTLQNGGAIGGSGADGLSGGSSTSNANRGAGGGGGLGAGGALFIGPSSIVTMGSNVSLLNNHAQGGKGGDTIIGNRDPSPTFLWGGGASFSDTKNTTTVYGGHSWGR